MLAVTIGQITGVNPPDNLIANGSFEQPVLGKPTWGTFVGDQIDEWNIVSTAGGKGEVQRLGLSTWHASEGNQWIELDGDESGPGVTWNAKVMGRKERGLYTIQQIVSGLTPGQVYFLSFDFAARPGTILAENHLGVSVIGDEGKPLKNVGGEVIAETSQVAPKSQPPRWRRGTDSFVAPPSGQATIRFTGLGSDNTFGMFLDNVVLLPAQTIVDLDVDSNNDGTIDPDNGPAGTDDRIESASDTPGKIIAVGGARVPMTLSHRNDGQVRLTVAAGGADRVRFWTSEVGGSVIPYVSNAAGQQAELAPAHLQGSEGLQTVWVEAIKPSESAGDVVVVLRGPYGDQDTDTVRLTAEDRVVVTVTDGVEELVFGVPADVTLEADEPRKSAEVIIVTASLLDMSNKRLRITADGGLDIWLNPETTQPLGSHDVDPTKPDVFVLASGLFPGETRLYVTGSIEGLGLGITVELIDQSGDVESTDRLLFSVEEYIDVRPLETLARLNTEIGAAMAGDALQYLTSAEYTALKDAGLEVGRFDGLWDYVFLKIGDNYYTYIEPSVWGFSYKLFAITPGSVPIETVKQGAEIANWLAALGATDVALSVLPGGTSAGYLEQGDYGRGALWFIADVGLTLSVVGKLGQVTAKAGAVVRSGSALRIGKTLNNVGKAGQYRHIVLGGTIATGVLGAESGAGAVNDALNGKYSDAAIKGLDAVFAALGVASSAKQYADALTDAAKANKKLAEKVNVQQVASKTAHGALSPGMIREISGSATTPLIENLSHIADDALVHLGPVGHSVVIPDSAGQIFTFRFGDIKHLSPVQIETIIGQLAWGGLPGGAKVLHVLDAPLGSATKVEGKGGFFEYVLTEASKVQEGWIVQ
jgi:hypothetical protein